MSFSEYANKNTKQIFFDLQTSTAGLNKKEVLQRQKLNKKNLTDRLAPNGLKIFGRQFCSPFIYILLFAAILAFFMGEKIDSLIIIGLVILNTVLGFCQEYHSEKAAFLLKKFLTHRAKVIRNNQEQIIDSQELVVGDILKLTTGDIVPADARIIENNGLLVDESILTGESMEVAKTEKTSKKKITDLFEADNIIFSGAKIISGEAYAIVFAVGNQTTIGNISKLTLETTKKSAFEKNIYKFSKFILQLIVVTIALIFIANLLIKDDNAQIIELLLFSTALAVGVIPEALPIVTTLALSKGAVRLAQKQVLVKRLSAVEDLGGVEILCSDKTGTITENIMQIVDVFSPTKNFTLLLAALTSEPIKQKNNDGDTNNSFDLAIWQKITPKIKAAEEKYQRIYAIPFSPDRRRNSVLVKNENHQQIIVRGALEYIIPLCRDLSENKKESLLKWEKKQGCLGRRVIAIAYKNVLNKKQEYAVNQESGLFFSGLISFFDPIKKTAKEAVQKAGDLGLKIKILTGDNAEVALAVGKAIGLVKNEKQMMTGAEFEDLTGEQQNKVIEKISIFARVSPEQKFKILEKLQKNKTVGYLGEGINDAPALKIANVSMVVNHASDIARDSADIILLNPDLNVIIDGIKAGREIFTNIVKYLKTTLISNFGNFFALAASSLFINYLPMLTVQILLLNLLSDAPMISIANDNIDPEEAKKPKKHEVHEVIIISVVLGIVSTVFDFLFFAIFMRQEPAQLQTAWFLGSVLTEIALIYSIRTKHWFWQAKRPSKTVLIPTIFAVALALFLVLTPIGHKIFHFEKPPFAHLLMIFGLVGGYFLISEILKMAYYRKTK